MTTDGSPADISWENLDGVSSFLSYTQTLAAQATGEESHSLLGKQGSALFDQLQSASCHVPSQRTGNNQQAVANVINDQTIWSYTDLLLHEMGPGLDDGFAEEGLSLSSQWRTAPLWGLAMTQTQRVNRKASFLHDGRARSIEEAIIWHAGEAKTAQQRYQALPQRQKDQLLAWLKQL